MTGYLLDTNACIALINGAPGEVRRRFQRHRQGGHHPVVLCGGVRTLVRSRQEPALNTQRLETFCAGPLEWTLFDDQDAREAGTVRAELEANGKPIGAYDVLLAGQARRLGATLVTSNVREFERVAGLRWEDWAAVRAKKR